MAETKNMATGVAVEEAGNDNAQTNTLDFGVVNSNIKSVFMSEGLKTLVMKAATRWVADARDMWPDDMSTTTVASMMNDFCVLHSDLYDRRGYDTLTEMMNVAGFLGELLDDMPPTMFTTDHINYTPLHELVKAIEEMV